MYLFSINVFIPTKTSTHKQRLAVQAKIVNNIKVLAERKLNMQKIILTKDGAKRQMLNWADYINPVSMKKEVYTREQIGKMSKAEFEKNEKAIMAQMKFIGVPTDYELQQSNAHDYENDKTLKWMWVAQADERTCADCEELDGTTYDNEEDAPPIPLHPNCRCVLVRVVEA